MKPIFTVISSIVITLILIFIALVAVSAYAVRQEKAQLPDNAFEEVTKTVNFDDNIRELHITAGIKADYQIKDTTGVQLIITSTRKGMEQLQTKMTNGKLQIYFNKTINLRLRKDTHITIIAAAAPGIELSAGASINAPGIYNGLRAADLSSGAILKIDSIVSSHVEFDLSSGASAKVGIYNTDSVEAGTSSGADIRINGQVRFVDFEASSGASINASQLKASSGTANATSGADIKCYVTDLKSKSSSGGSIRNISR